MSYQYGQSNYGYGGPQTSTFTPQLSKEEERRRKEQEEHNKKMEKEKNERMSYAHNVLSKATFGRVVSYHYAKDLTKPEGISVADGEKVRSNAVAFLSKEESSEERARRGLPPLQPWQQLVYIPSLCISGAVGAIAQRLADKFFKSDLFGKTCAQQGLYFALTSNLRSDFFISVSNLEGSIRVDPNIENLLTSQLNEDGTANISEELQLSFSSKIYDMLLKICNLVASAAIQQGIDPVRFNVDQMFANQSVGIIARIASERTSEISNIFGNFVGSYQSVMPIREWVSIETKHKRPSASYMLNFGNLLHIAKDVGVIESFQFQKIPSKYHYEKDGKLVGYTWMPDLTNASFAKKWADSNLLKINYKAFDKKLSGRVKAGEVVTTEIFYRNMENRFLNYNKEQWDGLCNGTKYLDPSGFEAAKGIKLDLKEQKDTQKVFPNNNITMVLFEDLRKFRDSGSADTISQRNQIVSQIILSCMKIGKRKFPTQNQAPTQEFMDIVVKVENVVALLGLDVGSVMQGMVRHQIMAIQYNYSY